MDDGSDAAGSECGSAAAATCRRARARGANVERDEDASRAASRVGCWRGVDVGAGVARVRHTGPRSAGGGSMILNEEKRIRLELYSENKEMSKKKY